MNAPHIILDNLPSLCQKLSDLVEVRQILFFKFLRATAYATARICYRQSVRPSVCHTGVS